MANWAEFKTIEEMHAMVKCQPPSPAKSFTRYGASEGKASPMGSYVGARGHGSAIKVQGSRRDFSIATADVGYSHMSARRSPRSPHHTSTLRREEKGIPSWASRRISPTAGSAAKGYHDIDDYDRSGFGATTQAPKPAAKPMEKAEKQERGYNRSLPVSNTLDDSELINLLSTIVY